VIMSEQTRRSGKEVIEDGLKDGLNKLQRYLVVRTVAPKVDLSGYCDNTVVLQPLQAWKSTRQSTFETGTCKGPWTASGWLTTSF
jgi:hypothetical protein